MGVDEMGVDELGGNHGKLGGAWECTVQHHKIHRCNK